VALVLPKNYKELTPVSRKLSNEKGIPMMLFMKFYTDVLKLFSMK